MKYLKKVLVSALISASLCSNITKAMSAAGWAGIVTAGLAVVGGSAAGIGYACSKKNGNKESGATEQIVDYTSQPENFYPAISNYDESTKGMLYDQLSGDGLKEFIVDCVGGKKKFGILEAFFDGIYRHGHIKSEGLKTNKIVEMSFETRSFGKGCIRNVSGIGNNVVEFFSRDENKNDIDFAFYAMARCLDPFRRSVTYKKLCKVVRKNYVGFEFRSDKDDLVSEDCICSVFVNKNNKNNIELRYQSDSRAFKCIFNLK